MLIKSLHTILCFSICLSSFFVAFSDNAITSIIFLILVFCNAAGVLLFIFNADFLGLIFIVIYVGAIAVLFLFVIMMLPVKDKKTDLLKKYGLIIFLLLFCLLFIQSFNFTSQQDFSFLNYLYTDNLNNITILGQVLFNYYVVCFLMAGIILLIALIGSIVLTLRYNKVINNQLVFRQLSRNNNFLSLIKN
jgi:NADH-quinone oxidoreductase subunit J